MRHRKDNSDIVPLDRLTARWLRRLEHITKTPAAQIVASMLHDIREDDEKMHAVMLRQSMVDETCH